MEIHYVYKITCTETGKLYIGISNNVERRFREHSRNNSHRKLARAIKKYGIDKFKYEILLMGSREYCGFMETQLISAWDTFKNGYNSSSGGETTIHYVPWNKDTEGICKPNKTSFKKGEPSLRQVLTEEDISRIIEDTEKGISPKDMTWLPVHWSQAYRCLRRLGIEGKKKRDMFRLQNLVNEIYDKYLSGISCKDLSVEYSLSFKLTSAYICKARKQRVTNAGNK